MVLVLGGEEEEGEGGRNRVGKSLACGHEEEEEVAQLRAWQRRYGRRKKQNIEQLKAFSWNWNNSF